jgi:hypothetical protein
MSNVAFNPAELATFDEAIGLRKLINYSPVFYTQGLQIMPYWGGVANDRSGIYLPVWVGGPGGFPEPNSGKALFYHFRFSNFFEGMNVGLVRELFRAYPTSPLYVLNQLLIEVQQGAKS